MLPDNEADPELASKLKLKREKEREKERAKVEKEKEYEEGIYALLHMNNLICSLIAAEKFVYNMNLYLFFRNNKGI